MSLFLSVFVAVAEIPRNFTSMHVAVLALDHDLSFGRCFCEVITFYSAPNYYYIRHAKYFPFLLCILFSCLLTTSGLTNDERMYTCIATTSDCLQVKIYISAIGLWYVSLSRQSL